MCIICTGEIYNENFDILQELHIMLCLKITSEKLQEILFQCKQLKVLSCYWCMSITSLDLRENKNLKIVGCTTCESLTSINLQENINLETLSCPNCISLTNLDVQKCNKLKQLFCHGCRSLTILKYTIVQYENVNIVLNNCTWIFQCPGFPSNLQNLIKLQRWYRRILIIKYLKSQEFIEWIYNPNNIGGRLHKVKLLKEFCI